METATSRMSFPVSPSQRNHCRGPTEATKVCVGEDVFRECITDKYLVCHPKVCTLKEDVYIFSIRLLYHIVSFRIFFMCKTYLYVKRKNFLLVISSIFFTVTFQSLRSF